MRQLSKDRWDVDRGLEQLSRTRRKSRQEGLGLSFGGWEQKCSWFCEAVIDHVMENSCDSHFGPSFEAMRETLKALELRERGGTPKMKA